MVKVKWGKGEVEVNCSEEELAEVLSWDNDIMLGCWLGLVNEKGHAAGVEWAKEYDEILRGEG